MVAIFSTPKLLPISSIPRRHLSLDFEPVYRTTVESALTHESRFSRSFRWMTLLLYTLLVFFCASGAVYYCANSSTIDIWIPRPLHNQSLSIAHRRLMGRMKDSDLHFVQINFYAMARFRHPGIEVTVDSITVSVYNGFTRVGGGEYSPTPHRYPIINSKGDITEITMLPKATILEGELGYKGCSSMESTHNLSLRLYYSILIHKKNIFGMEIKSRVEYSQNYSICCSCEMRDEYFRQY